MKLRSYLFLLIAVPLLPAIAFSVFLVTDQKKQEFVTLERGMRDTARALVTAFDREILTSVQALKVLGAFSHLDADRLSDFYKEMEAALAAYGSAWQNLTLTDPTGQQLINLRRPFGSPLPRTGNPEAIEKIRQTMGPVVADLSLGPVTGAPAIVVHVPVLKNDQVRYILNAIYYPASLTDILLEQKLPKDWLAAIVDGKQNLVAATHVPENFTGAPASPDLIAAINTSDEGWFEGLVWNTEATYTAFSRSRLTGWAVAIGAPAAEFKASVNRTLAITVGGGSGFLLLGLTAAFVMGRRITGSIHGLSSRAEVLAGMDDPPSHPVPQERIVEVAQLTRSLEDAASRRRLAEDALREREERFRHLAENIREIFFITGPTGTPMFYVSPVYEEVTGRSRKSLYEDASAWVDFVHPEDRERVADAYRNWPDKFDQEYRFMRPDGQIKWIHARTFPVLDEKGTILRLVGIAEDITKRKQAELEVIRNLSFIRALHEIDLAIMSTLDLEAVLKILLDKIDGVLPNCAVVVRLFDRHGQSRRVAVRNLDENALAERERNTGPGLTSKAFRDRKPIFISDLEKEPGVRNPDFFREHGLVSCLIVPLFPKDEPVGVVTLYSRKRRFTDDEVEFAGTLAGQAAIALHNAQVHKELIKANQVKDEFLGVMSHELRTPLNVMIGYTALIKDGFLGEVNPEQTKALQKIHDQAAEQLAMANNVLYATVLEVQKPTVDLQELSLVELLDQLQADCDSRLFREELALRWDYSRDWPLIRSDRIKIVTILKNLISNALKFTQNGTVTVSARLLEEVENGNWLDFKVADTGIGISKDQLSSVFEKFRQIDSSETRAYGGVGMGLYIVKRFTELLGGTVTVESEVDAGSVFTVKLPLE